METMYQLLGRTAFDAYKQSKQGTTYDNKPIPEWKDLGDDVRTAWCEAAKAVFDYTVIMIQDTADVGNNVDD